MREEDREEELKFLFFSNSLPSLSPEMQTVLRRIRKRGQEMCRNILALVSVFD